MHPSKEFDSYSIPGVQRDFESFDVSTFPVGMEPIGSFVLLLLLISRLFYWIVSLDSFVLVDNAIGFVLVSNGKF